MYNNDRRLSLWDVAYSFYFLSFFIDDLAFTSEVTQNLIIKAVRYIAYLLFVMVMGSHVEDRQRRIIAVACGLAATAFCTLFNRDLYYETLLFVIFVSYKVKPRHVVRLSYRLLMVLTLLTVAGALAGIIPMVNTPRAWNSADRLGLGFYHSNVMPLVLFYLIAYRMMLDYRHIRRRRILLWVALALVVYHFCESKNGVISVALLCMACVVYRRKKHSELLYFVSKYLVLFLMAISVAGTLLQESGIPVVKLLNQAMTNRFGIAYRQYLKMGLPIISRMDGETYKSVREVLDNGYLYVAFRFGVAFLPFYGLIHFLFSRRNRKVPLALAVCVVISLTNFIDNDLLSYGYLPMIILAFNRYSLEVPADAAQPEPSALPGYAPWRMADER